MFATSAPSRPISAAVRGPLRTAGLPRGTLRKALSVAHVGYLLPATSDGGIVHSVFAHACNIACDHGLLTLVAGTLADGPTVWRLAGHAAPDFRRLFTPGERLSHRNGVAATRDVVLDLSTALCWCPAPPPVVSGERLTANLRLATAALERRRRECSSVVDREARESLMSLESACRRLDLERATAEIHRLVGWGEGLTPSGDDALVGLLAGLGALGADSDQLAFLRSLAAAVLTRTARTTVISAHYLELAAQGHFNADVTHLAHALVGADETADGAGVLVPLGAALNVGATSGADMVSGIIAGFRAWCPAVAE